MLLVVVVKLVDFQDPQFPPEMNSDKLKGILTQTLTVWCRREELLPFFHMASALRFH